MYTMMFQLPGKCDDNNNNNNNNNNNYYYNYNNNYNNNNNYNYNNLKEGMNLWKERSDLLLYI